MEKQATLLKTLLTSLAIILIFPFAMIAMPFVMLKNRKIVKPMYTAIKNRNTDFNKAGLEETTKWIAGQSTMIALEEMRVEREKSEWAIEAYARIDALADAALAANDAACDEYYKSIGRIEK